MEIALCVFIFTLGIQLSPLLNIQSIERHLERETNSYERHRNLVDKGTWKPKMFSTHL
jgi:hypothetical protein